MLKTFSFDYMIENSGCYGRYKTIELFFMNRKDDISIDTIINSDIPLNDKYWFVFRKTELTAEQKRSIAIDVAEIVLPIYEKRYPNYTAPREAIEAAKQFIGGHISIEALIERRDAVYAASYAASYAAYDAAYASYAAADASAYASYAASYAAAADASANAAYAASDAAADASYAANADINYTQLLTDHLRKFVSNN